MAFAFLFPGQGSQSLNMMDGFAAAVVKDTFDEASDALLEYGTIEPEQAAAITETREKYAAREEAAAAQAEEVAPAQSGTASSAEPAKRFILCPKCGERIWL